MRGTPKIDAIVIAPNFRTDAQSIVLSRLTRLLGIRPNLNLQQVVASDIESQTRAMVDAAMERTAAGISRDVPPFADIRAALGIPVQSLWTNRAERIVNIVPVAAPGWTLADYRAIEDEVATNAGGWQAWIVPPVQPNIAIASDPEARVADTALAIWAVQRWGLRSVNLDLPVGSATREAAQAELDELTAGFAAAQIDLRGRLVESSDRNATIFVFAPSPSQRRAEAAKATDAAPPQ